MAETSARLDPLTGLRGIAAYSVLIAHAMDSAFSLGEAPIFSNFGTFLAWFGMTLFFVLSGFVIHYNHADSFAREGLAAATWRFFVARFSGRSAPSSQTSSSRRRLHRSWCASAFGGKGQRGQRSGAWHPFQREPKIMEWEHLLAAIAVVAISIGLATLSYIYFETPIRRYAAS
jgi:peptidoglycan/LPS O-acetylase OafA/YrhL